MRDVLKFIIPELDNAEFKVNAEATIKESQQIEDIVAEVYGSRIKLEEARADLEVRIENAQAEKADRIDILVILKTKSNLEMLQKLANLEVLGVEISLDLAKLSIREFQFVERAYEVSLNEFFQRLEEKTINGISKGI
jgi:hypothetical protein